MSYMLYYFPYSICSLMVRYTLAVRGPPVEGEVDWKVEEKDVNIITGDQLTEHFLSEVNPAGFVPVLANPAVLRKPLAESQDITLYIAEHYPRLLPLALRNEIIQRLSDLHTINYFSLSFTGRPDVALGLKNRVIKALQDPKSSAKYQELLKHKLSIIENDKIGGLTSNRVAEAEERTSAVLGDLVVRQTQEGKGRGPWILDTEYPTALDAHLAIFLARLQDVNRHDLIPPELSEYVKTAIAGPEFSAALKGVEGGRTVGKKV